MSSLQCFRDLITERLTVAAEEIFRHVERTVVEYEEELYRQRKLLEIVCQPRVNLQRIELPQQHVSQEEEVLTEQQLWNQERNSSLDQEEPESGQIKEEQETICTSHEGEQLEVKQEADALMLTLENEESDHMEPGRNLQHRPFMKWVPVIMLQRTELPQQHVPKEEEVLTEQQLWNQERNSSLDQEEPESLQIKEEQAEICTSHEGEQLEVKQETDTLLLTPENEESDHMEPGRNLHHRLHMKWGPVIKLQRTELPQQHVPKEEEVLTEQQQWNQERNSSLDQEEPESLQSTEEQEADTLLLTPVKEESDHMEPEPDSDHQLLSHSSPVAQSQDQTGSHHVDSLSNSHAESRPCITKVENCDTSKIESETYTGKKSFKCDTCGKRFVYKSRLIIHMKVHAGEKPFSCTTCGSRFISRKDLIVHERIHSGERPYSCKTCGRSFALKQSLAGHERIHSGEKPYSCKTCGKDFALSQNLAVHERIHSGERPYSCKICGKRFIQSQSLTVHERIHSGEKPYSCKICGKRFLRSSHVIIHERIHSGEKPYFCKTCGKSFTQRQDLIRHERIHSGEKPYSCKTCGKGYSRKLCLTIHERTHSGKKP
ncbi:zinc finger protein 391-like isoform X2 [Solea solea]|uniref:zinc finger protein 391-like isoform X2 n=1 Tax=Solea solea TaxID=90069 RepID=UPI00272A1C15|nr:zinc finger protein 391-like isoform X2 [Solea solea]